MFFVLRYENGVVKRSRKLFANKHLMVWLTKTLAVLYDVNYVFIELLLSMVSCNYAACLHGFHAGSHAAKVILKQFDKSIYFVCSTAIWFTDLRTALK